MKRQLCPVKLNDFDSLGSDEIDKKHISFCSTDSCDANDIFEEPARKRCRLVCKSSKIAIHTQTGETLSLHKRKYVTLASIVRLIVIFLAKVIPT